MACAFGGAQMSAALQLQMVSQLGINVVGWQLNVARPWSILI
jgi:hypothetical protein